LSLSHCSPQQGANTADNAAATVLTTVLTKKSELAGKIRKRIDDSEKRKIEITEESVANDEVGAKLEDALAAFAQDVQLERYRGHVDEVEKVTSLLLCLAGRLARMEGEEGEEATSKRTKLLSQLEEAKVLKKRIDKRGETVGKGLGDKLGEEKRTEYLTFLRTKERLVIEKREVEEKLRLSRDQLRALL